MIPLLTLLSISQIKGIGNVALSFFRNYCNENKVYEPTQTEIEQIFKILNQKNKRVKSISLDSIKEGFEKGNSIQQLSNDNDVKIITIDSTEYPHLLKSIKNPPMILHAKGNTDCLVKHPTVAIIGTREPTRYGASLGRRISDILTDKGYTLVSGLAIGCDTIAHQSSIQHKNTTIAVLAGGLQSVYPKENVGLSEDILANNGLLLSEQAFGTRPSQNTFVSRDRIQSGLSLGTIVIQTGIKGGTLHTAKFTLDQNRVLGCLYSDNEMEIKHEKFQGNKQLIKNGALQISSQNEIESFLNQINHGLDSTLRAV